MRLLILTDSNDRPSVSNIYFRVYDLDRGAELSWHIRYKPRGKISIDLFKQVLSRDTHTYVVECHKLTASHIIKCLYEQYPELSL